MFPCDFGIINFCGLTAWDATIIQLIIGAIVATIFFKIQGKNTKMLNLIWKERFEHLQENTINNLLWMKEGCLHLQLQYKKVSNNPNPIQGLIDRFPLRQNKEFVIKLKEANERTITSIRNYIEMYPETISPQLENTLDKISIENKKIQTTDEREHGNSKVLSEIINQIDLLNKKYHVKKSGQSPEDIYVETILNKLRKDTQNVMIILITPGIIILSISIFSHSLFLNDILNDWITYLGIYLTIFGLSFKSKKEWMPGLWLIFGGIIMLIFTISIILNPIHF